MRRRDLFRVEPRRWGRATLGAEPSMFSGDPLRLLLQGHLGHHAFEDARVDGAIGHPGTLAHADGCGVDEIYLLPAGYPCAAAAPSTALGTALTAVSVLLHRQLVEEVRAYTGHARLHVVPPLCPLAISPADFTHVDSLIHCAHASTDPVAALPPGRGGAGHRRRSTRPPRPTPSPQIHRRRRPPPAASSLIGDPRS